MTEPTTETKESPRLTKDQRADLYKQAARVTAAFPNNMAGAFVVGWTDIPHAPAIVFYNEGRIGDLCTTVCFELREVSEIMPSVWVIVYRDEKPTFRMVYAKELGRIEESMEGLPESGKGGKPKPVFAGMLSVGDDGTFLDVEQFIEEEAAFVKTEPRESEDIARSIFRAMRFAVEEALSRGESLDEILADLKPANWVPAEA